MRKKNVDSIYVNYNLWKKNVHFVFSFLLLLFYFSVVFVLQLKELSNYIIDIILFRVANLKLKAVIFTVYYSSIFIQIPSPTIEFSVLIFVKASTNYLKFFLVKKKKNSNTSFWCLFSSSIRM